MPQDLSQERGALGRLGLLDERMLELRHGQRLADQGDFWSPVRGRFALTHGPFFEVLLVALERQLPMEDVRDRLLLRHLCIHLIFCAGVGFFFLLLRRLLGGWRPALLGAALLVLSPRVFAHSFNNSMDIPFLATFVASMFTMLRLLERPTLLNGLAHGLACGVLIATRIAGIIAPAITLGFLVVELCAGGPARRAPVKAAASAGACLLVTALVTVAAWPVLWSDPWRQLVTAFEISANDPWHMWEMYMGQRVKGSEVPWHFSAVWMLITTPPLYSLLVPAGLWAMASRRGGSVRAFYLQNRGLLVCLVCFLAPLAAVALFGSTLFNGWRHLYFVYPGFLALAVAGLVHLWRRCEAAGPRWSRVLRGALAGAVALSMAVTGAFMVRSHPHQIAYFNVLVGGFSGARQRFQVGYWGAEYKEALEYLVRNVEGDRGSYTVYLSDNPTTLLPLMFNARILPPRQRHRVHFVTSKVHGQFFITNYSAHIPPCEGRKLWSRVVDGAPVVSVLRLR